jgi:S1-C subfamily serine protease
MSKRGTALGISLVIALAVVAVVAFVLTRSDDKAKDTARVEGPTNAAVDAQVRNSVVRVSGRACGQIQEGSGWVSTSGLVVTTAHVVAGEDRTTVEDVNGRKYQATVVAFDAGLDLAVLRVRDLTAPGLTLEFGRVGDVGTVYGHPDDGALRAVPARVAEKIVAAGTNIYRTGSSRRSVYVLATSVDELSANGGALVNANGDVIGVVFAADPVHHDATYYAVADDEVRAVLETVDHAQVATGPCIVG